MKITLSKRIGLLAFLLPCALALSTTVHKRTEKEWDKADAAFDNRDKCEQSANINAYWEPNTLRCLDRRTGRVITP